MATAEEWPDYVRDWLPEDRQMWLQSLEGQRWVLCLRVQELKAAVDAELGWARRLVYAISKALAWIQVRLGRL